MMKWLFKELMIKKHISSFKELAKLTGIEYRTLINHVADASLFRVSELRALAKVLDLKDEELLRLIWETE